MTPPSPEALEAARKWTDTMWMRGAGWVEEYEHNMARALDAFAAEAVERERRKWEADRAAGWNAAHGIGGKP